MKKEYDIKNLPKWSQSELTVLKNNNQYLRKQLDEMFQKEPSNVYLHQRLGKKYLPKDSSISFIVNGKPISIMFRDEYLDINGRGTMEILPRASNSIYIRHV